MMLIHDRLSPLAAQQTDVRAQLGPTTSVSAVLWRLETPQLSIRSPVGKRVEVDKGVARPWSEVQLPHLDTCGSMAKMLAPGTSGDPDGAEGAQPELGPISQTILARSAYSSAHGQAMEAEKKFFFFFLVPRHGCCLPG